MRKVQLKPGRNTINWLRAKIDQCDRAIKEESARKGVYQSDLEAELALRRKNIKQETVFDLVKRRGGTGTTPFDVEVEFELLSISASVGYASKTLLRLSRQGKIVRKGKRYYPIFRNDV